MSALAIDLRRTAGFLVADARGRVVGTVECPMYGTSPETPDALSVRSGWLARRRRIVPADSIEQIDDGSTFTSSICSIDSAGTIRRRRASQPERTESASGISGEVPYIGHSTVPTTRPRASATRNPAVRRRSIASALIALNLFPVCEETPSPG